MTWTDTLRARIITTLEDTEHALAWEADHRATCGPKKQHAWLLSLADDVNALLHAIDREDAKNKVIQLRRPPGGAA